MSTPKATKLHIIPADEPITANIDSLEPEQTIAFAPNRYNSLRSICSARGFETGKAFSVRIDRKNNCVTVTRIA